MGRAAFLVFAGVTDYNEQMKPTQTGSLSRKAALALAAATVLGAAAWAGRLYLAVPLPDSAMDFSYPYSVIVAPDGSAVVSDLGERRLVGLDAEGRLRFAVRGERRRGGFYSGRLLGYDAAGNFYLDDTVYDLATNNTAARRIVRFSPSGTFRGVVGEYRFEGDAMSDWMSHPMFGQVRDGNAYWFKNDGEGLAHLLVMGLEGVVEGQDTPIRGADLASTVSAAVTGPGEAFFLMSDGRIDRWAKDGGYGSWLPPGEGGTGIRFPTKLAAAEDALFAVDSKSRILRIPFAAADRAPGPVAAYFDGSARLDPVMFQTLGVGTDGSVALCDEREGAILLLKGGSIIRRIERAEFGFSFRVLHSLVWLCAFLASFFALAATVLFYAGLLGRRSPLVVKQLFIMLPIITAMVAAVALYVYGSLSGSLGGQVRDRLLHLAHMGAGRVPAERLEAIPFGEVGFRELLDSPDYAAVVSVLDELVNLNEDSWDSTIFPYVYARFGTTWWILGSFEYVEPYPYAKKEFEEVLRTGESRYFRYSDVYGAWLSALAPVKDGTGRPVAILEASMSADILDEVARGFMGRAALGGGGILAVFLAMLGAFTYYLLNSVKKLQKGVEKVSTGDYEIHVAITSKDELEDLGNAFNGMSAEIKNSVMRLAAFGAANARFVPRGFIERLGRKNITEVRLGDQVLTEMTVLFSDIREFTAVSERMGPVDTISMLNEYLSRIGPVVREHGGFIDKYIGDAIMALFPEGSAGAVAAILEMMDALDQYRQVLSGRGKEVIDAGFAIHTGPVMLGIIGEEERYDGTVISDTVNLASRLESLTKYYGVRALLSDSSVRGLNGKELPVRFLDEVRVKGKSRSVRLYELVSRNDPLRAGKLGSATRYGEAFAAYARGDFDAAAKGFSGILEDVPGDPATRLLLDRSLRYVKEGAPAEWTGVTVFHEK